MTCVVVNDASCLIDLRKGGLLAVVGNLPYRFVVPLPVRESEVLDFSNEQWRQLDDAGMITHDLTPNEVAQALALKERHPAHSANDSLCFVTTLAHDGILLTGDALLRRVAIDNGRRVHGVLWIVDELDAARGCARSLLIQALRNVGARAAAATTLRFYRSGAPTIAPADTEVGSHTIVELSSSGSISESLAVIAPAPDEATSTSDAEIHHRVRSDRQAQWTRWHSLLTARATVSVEGREPRGLSGRSAPSLPVGRCRA